MRKSLASLIATSALISISASANVREFTLDDIFYRFEEVKSDKTSVKKLDKDKIEEQRKIIEMTDYDGDEIPDNSNFSIEFDENSNSTFIESFISGGVWHLYNRNEDNAYVFLRYDVDSCIDGKMLDFEISSQVNNPVSKFKISIGMDNSRNIVVCFDPELKARSVALSDNSLDYYFPFSEDSKIHYQSVLSQNKLIDQYWQSPLEKIEKMDIEIRMPPFSILELKYSLE
ncbi:hypothetical protein COU57_03450 [Candidatus Pacearchaeota archaeon CG10_big_fil_rev_8_21_14_0_10_32_14]|nr:MAG: hypothetical protein COU57_03450 [Candidatus Pacearchaeota archaeon CG10_big_fil_rev_8_21_14_0_10_32_14]